MKPYLRLLFFALLGLLFVSAAFASDDTSSLTNITGISLQTQLYITWATIAFKYLSEFYSAVRCGGGLRRILLAFWFGENLPKVVAQDYKAELTTPAATP